VPGILVPVRLPQPGELSVRDLCRDPGAREAAWTARTPVAETVPVPRCPWGCWGRWARSPVSRRLDVAGPAGAGAVGPISCGTSTAPALLPWKKSVGPTARGAAQEDVAGGGIAVRRPHTLRDQWVGYFVSV